jgi:peptidase M1-like protein
MSLRILWVASFLCAMEAAGFAQAPRGIPRELARQRAAQISEVRYHVAFVLTPKAASTAGEEEIHFNLKEPQPVLLDFRDGEVKDASVNGAAITLKAENGHLELPANLLRLGQNTIALQFVAAIAAAGKPLTRFEDHDDESEYVYSLFVPMDASMAFPCFDQPDLKARFRLELTAPENWTVISNTAVERDAAAARDKNGPGLRKLGRSAHTFSLLRPGHFENCASCRGRRDFMCGNQSSTGPRRKHPRCSRWPLGESNIFRSSSRNRFHFRSTTWC